MKNWVFVICGGVIGGCFVAAGIWAVTEFNDMDAYNQRIVQANCTLIGDGTLVGVEAGSCDASWQHVKMPWNGANDIKNAYDNGDHETKWFENVPCLLSALRINYEGRTFQVNQTVMNFKQQVVDCNRCASSRTATSYRIDDTTPLTNPTCADFQGNPIKTCRAFVDDLVRDEAHSTTLGFDCSYLAADNTFGQSNAFQPSGYVTPGKKEGIAKPKDAMMVLAVMLFSIGAAVFASGCCLAVCCAICHHGSKHDDHEPKE